MDKETRSRLEAAGFRIGDAEDFLGLTEEERRLVELRLAASRAVRRRRIALGVTQLGLARKLKSSQSRVAKIEAGAADVSLDLLFRALFAAGGGLADLTEGHRPGKRRKATARGIADKA
jgi:DNA-binding XRE family transcriptional regulator